MLGENLFDALRFVPAQAAVKEIPARSDVYQVASVDACHRAIRAHLGRDRSRSREEPPGDDRGRNSLRGQPRDGVQVRGVHRSGSIEKRAV